jgi:hypothetical protein
MRSSRAWGTTLAILFLNAVILHASTSPNDFDGDGRSDIGCYYAPGGNWYVFQSADGFWETAFGYTGTIPVTGDFDGDGLADIGCYYPPGGNWYIFKSRDGFWETKFGYTGTIPVTGDFDGDGKTDIGCYYPPGGNWYVFKSTEGFWQTAFGYSGTVPVTGDFDGDGKTDIGCYYAPGGNWYVFKSTEGFWQTQFGYGGTVPVTGDFDADGRTDIGCYYAPGGNWYVFKSKEGFWQTQFGYSGTVPVTGDFDADGRSDIGCYYAPGGNWYVFKSKEGFWQTAFGYSGTVPVMCGITWGAVAVTANPSLGGTVTGAGLYPAGSSAAISATPQPGWSFAGWSDGVKAATRNIVVPASGVNLLASFVYTTVPATWEPGKSIGGFALGDTFASVKARLGAPGEIRSTLQDDGTWMMWSDYYDRWGLSMAYVDSNGNLQLDDNEVIDGIFAWGFENPPPYNYKGITFGSSHAAAVSVLGPESWLGEGWWLNLGVCLSFTDDEVGMIYVFSAM